MIDPWEDGRSSIDHIEHCELGDRCDRCEHLTEFYMGCDNCGYVGHVDSDGWYLRHGIPFCSERCADEMNPPPQPEPKEPEPIPVANGTFVMKTGADGKTLWNEYNCDDCDKAGKRHEVVNVPHGQTGRYSTWGPGVPTTRRECTKCKRWDGPWVSAELVGGGW